MSARRRVRAAAFGALLALAAVPLASTAAFAHDSLVSADPSAGSTVESAEAVTLQFNNSPLGIEGSNIVQVIGPDGRYYETGCPALDGPLVQAPVKLGAAGEYEVRWRVVSSDGHPVTDEYRFTYEPSSSASPAEGSKTPHCGEAETASPQTGTEETARESGNPGLWIGIGIGGIVILGVAIAAWVILRRPAQ